MDSGTRMVIGTRRRFFEHGRAISTRTWFVLLLVVATGLRVWFSSTLSLSGDEAYHWEWSRHLAPAYWDHPGLTALLIRAAGLVALNTELSVRLPAVLCLTGTAAVAYAFARRVTRRSGETEVRAERAGFFAGVFLLFLPAYTILAVYMSTDPPFILFGASTWYLLYRALESDGPSGRWPAWLGAGAALGLAASAKFLAFLILPTALLVLCVHPPYRRWLRKPQPYVALAVAAAFFAPVLVWNAQNDWATFRFNFLTRQSLEFSPSTTLEYIGGQAVILSPWMLVVALLGLLGAWRGWRGTRDGTTLFLLGGTLVPVVFFLAISGLREVGMHWPATFWIPALVYVAAWWARSGEPAADRLRPWMRRSLAASVAFGLLLYGIAHLPPAWTDFEASFFGAHGRIRMEAFDERYGWPELGVRLEEVRSELAFEGGREVFLLGTQYGVVSSGAFYTPGQPHVFLWSPPRRHGESFRYWDDFGKLRGLDACFFSKREHRLREVLPALERHFDHLGPTEELRIERSGRLVQTFYIVRCYGFDGTAPYDVNPAGQNPPPDFRLGRAIHD